MGHGESKTRRLRRTANSPAELDDLPDGVILELSSRGLAPYVVELRRRIFELEARCIKLRDDQRILVEAVCERGGRIDALDAENKRLTLLRDHLQTTLESTELELSRAQARLAAQPPQQEGE
tara:strand:- start:2465 stop:2830 length:366 start_codon:yes stop_codon:yes gene_type:complete